MMRTPRARLVPVVVCRRWGSAAAAGGRQTSVLVVGGGPAGLTCALALARYGIPHLLVEPRLRPSEHPRAHVVGARSMEIFSGLGVAPAIQRGAASLDTWRTFRYAAAVDGQSDVAVADHAAGPAWRNLVEASPCKVLHVSQPRVETALRDKLQEYNADPVGRRVGETLYGRSVRSLDEDEALVKATLDDGSVVSADYCVGADGASGAVRRWVQRGWAARVPSEAALREARALRDLGGGGRGNGIIVERGGEKAASLQTFVSVHFESRDLASRVTAEGRPAMLYFVLNDRTIAVVVGHDLERGVWNLQKPLFHPWDRAGDACAPAAVEAAIRDVLHDGRLPRDLRVHSARAWSMTARLDATMRRGRCFLAGDAAHEMPPSGGLGMNTAVQDAHNLAWRLAWAHTHGGSSSGGGGGGVLDAYDGERRAAAAANIAVSLDNWRRGLLVPRALGLDPAALDTFAFGTGFFLPEAAARQTFRATMAAARALMLTNPSPDRRAAVAALVHDRKELPLFFPQVDLGHRYDGKSTVEAAEEGLRNARGPAGSALYVPRFAAGERLPHFVDGRTHLTSLRLLRGEPNAPPRYTFLASATESAGCREAAAAVGPDKVALIVVDGCEAGLERGAAVLVRPDGYIAHRWHPDDLQCAATLEKGASSLYMCRQTTKACPASSNIHTIGLRDLLGAASCAS